MRKPNEQRPEQSAQGASEEPKADKTKISSDINKQYPQTDALREARLCDMPDYETWLERFFGRVAPWVDIAEDGDQHLSGDAIWGLNGGWVTVRTMAGGRTAYDGWESMLFTLAHCTGAVESEEIEARKKELSARAPLSTRALASRVRALTRARIIQMVQEEAPAFASHKIWGPGSEFNTFIRAWSFRAGALLTFAIADGKGTKTAINEVVEDAFVASGGKFVAHG